MKILKVKKSDLTEMEAEKKFYAVYKPTKDMVKKNVEKMYSILYQLQNSAIKKQQELDKEMEKTPGVKTTSKVWGNSSEHIWNDYPEFKKKKQEIERMRNLMDNMQFMINELGFVRQW